ncbi:DUF3060 domain-containing protein [Sphingomonas sp.]|uniref:DUF3060 domain-containing protein n=1 Tax=Sphingomonas sp. TaxID=28214 RepID=UPI003CC5FFC2
MRSGGTVIDATGVHTGRTSVTGHGVSTHGRARGGAGIVIDTNHGDRAADCGGGALTVNGNHNRLRVANCRLVSVPGNWNELTIAFASPGRLDVEGNNDTIRWRAPRGVSVAVSNVGTRTSVTRTGM